VAVDALGVAVDWATSGSQCWIASSSALAAHPVMIEISIPVSDVHDMVAALTNGLSERRREFQNDQ
jgi:hypothetical protein